MDPHDKDQLAQSLQETKAQIEAYAAAISQDQFFAGSVERWSVAHHLEHLRVSNRPVAQALGAPKILLRVVALGKPVSPSRSYIQIRDTYRQALAGGVKATGRYVPNLQSQSQTEVIQTFIQAAEGVVSVLSKWEESSLDEFALPHPVLGQLTVREMLFFTLYHNQHHLEGMRRVQGLSQAG